MHDSQLLDQFVRDESETAFRTLVERHAPLVFGTAQRLTGDRGLAEEIAQTVFMLLARKAARLGRETVLSGWLYRATRFVAARALTSEYRRRRREQEAARMQSHHDPDPDPSWQRVAARLDEGLGCLRETDRNALLLRFFEERPVREVGDMLGLSEEAAKKRVARALEKLRRILQRRGIEITALALAAGLARECVAAAVPVGLCAQWSKMALAQSVATTATTAGTASVALLAEVLAAWRWVYIKGALLAGTGLVALLLVLPPTIRTLSRAGRNAASPASAAATSSLPQTGSSAANGSLENIEPTTMIIAGQTVRLRRLDITVLDAESGAPLADAGVSHSMMWSREGDTSNRPLRSDANGLARLHLPEWVPNGERQTQFEVWINATNHAARTVLWLCTTGQVLSTVSTQYTVRLEAGRTLAGTVVDESGQPLAGVWVGAHGNSYRGYTTSYDETGRVLSPPEVRIDDFPTYSVSSEESGAGNIRTDRRGRFQLEHFPSDLRALVLELRAIDGAQAKFRTAQGKTLTADNLPEISIEELRLGTARLTIPRGVTVEGVVVDQAGQPVMGATVMEGSQWGNLKVLSRGETDFFGRFSLSNRAPRESILAASADGYSSASIAVQIHAGMSPVEIRFTPERPLRGRIVNEAGEPVPAANVTLPDVWNEGLGLQWRGTTDAEGRFQWRGAPTNELTLDVTADSYPYRLVHVPSSTNEHVITLSMKPTSSVRVTGRVTDAATAEPVDRFKVKLSYGMDNSTPRAPFRTVDGADGKLDVEIAQREIPMHSHPAYILLVEAEGYESVFTGLHHFEEGDLRLDFALPRGGALQGIVHTPNIDPAANAQLAFAPEADAVPSFEPGKIGRQNQGGRTDGAGRFKLKTPPKTRWLVAFHETGWAITPIQPAGGDPNVTNVTLLPWGRIEGVLWNSNAPLARERIGLSKLTWYWGEALTVQYSTTTDESGRFVFEQVPAGEFVVSWRSSVWQRTEQPAVEALQTTVKLAAGDSQQIELRASGGPVFARLRAGAGSTRLGWSNALPILTRDVGLPREPQRSDYLSNESQRAARFRWATDPAVLAALRETRSYVGRVNPDGTAVFEQVPPGRYVLELKLFAPEPVVRPRAGNSRVEPAGHLRVPVTIGEPAEPGGTGAPVFLGEFTVEPL